MANYWRNAAFKNVSIFLLCLFSFSLARADKIGTIVLISGQSYEGVSYKVNSIYKVIKITASDGVHNVSFNDIAKITDMAGNDITVDVIGVYGKNPISTPGDTAKQWISQNSEIHRQAKIKLWQTILRLSGSYSIPAGDYYEGIGSGIGYEGELRVAINHEIALRFMVSRTGLGMKDEMYFYSLDPDVSILSQDIGFSGIRYLAGIEYYSHLDKNNKSDKDMSMWFAYAGLGAFTNKMTLDMRLRTNSTGQTWDFDDSYSETKFIFSFGFGIDKSITPEIGLELAAGFDMEAVGSGENELGHEVPVYAYILDLRVGLIYFIK